MIRCWLERARKGRNGEMSLEALMLMFEGIHPTSNRYMPQLYLFLSLIDLSEVVRVEKDSPLLLSLSPWMLSLSLPLPTLLLMTMLQDAVRSDNQCHISASLSL